MSHTSVSGARSTAVPARGPVVPALAFPVIDRLVGARPTRVLGIDPQTPTIHRLRIERPDGYHFQPGQHALLRLRTEQGPDLRPLSLAGPPDGDVLEFATRAGTSAFKQALVALRPGEPVKVSRPMGGFAYDTERPAVLVAGGLGITPIRSVLLAHSSDPGSAPVRLLFSNRTSDEIPFAGELAELARRHPTLSITWILTAPPAGTLSGPVHVGRISADLLRQQAAELPDALFYLAGPPHMVSDVHSMLRTVGVASRRIRSVAQGRR